MRSAVSAAVLIAMTLPALADGAGAVRVIPGYPGVPVPIEGLDASYAVVEGDWGLAKNVHNYPVRVMGGHAYPPPPEVGHYYPSSGKIPGYGRLEVEPPDHRKLPREAESYYRSWSVQSAPPPEPLLNPPAVIVAPQFNGPVPGLGPSPRGR